MLQNKNISVPPFSLNILDLNEDCLLQIFKWLPLEAQVRFGSVCPLLRNVFQYHCQLCHKILQKDDLKELSVRDMKCFFALAGQHITQLINLPYGVDERNIYVTLINKFCRNIQKICIEHSKIESYWLKKLLANMQYLNSLHLVNCNLYDDAVEWIASLENLQSLHFYEQSEISGKSLWKLSKLTELVFIECGIEDKYLVEIFKSASKLRKLSILGCSKISNISIFCMSTHCRELQELKLSGTDSMDCLTIAESLKLTMLELYKENFSNDTCRRFFEALTTNSGNQLKLLRIYTKDVSLMQHAKFLSYLTHLEKLNLDCNKFINATTIAYISQLQHLQTLSLRRCESITNEAILILLNYCPTIKHINVMYCKQLNDQLIYSAIKALQRQQYACQKGFRNEPVLMLVGGTGIHRSVRVEPIYTAASSLLRLNFMRPSRNTRANIKYIYRIRVLGELKYFY